MEILRSPERTSVIRHYPGRLPVITKTGKHKVRNGVKQYTNFVSVFTEYQRFDPFTGSIVQDRGYTNQAQTSQSDMDVFFPKPARAKLTEKSIERVSNYLIKKERKQQTSATFKKINNILNPRNVSNISDQELDVLQEKIDNIRAIRDRRANRRAIGNIDLANALFTQEEVMRIRNIIVGNDDEHGTSDNKEAVSELIVRMCNGDMFEDEYKTEVDIDGNQFFSTITIEPTNENPATIYEIILKPMNQIFKAIKTIKDNVPNPRISLSYTLLFSSDEEKDQTSKSWEKDENGNEKVPVHVVIPRQMVLAVRYFDILWLIIIALMGCYWKLSDSKKKLLRMLLMRLLANINHTLLNVGSYIEEPASLKKKYAIAGIPQYINPKNDDMRCLLWCYLIHKRSVSLLKGGAKYVKECKDCVDCIAIKEKAGLKGKRVPAEDKLKYRCEGCKLGIEYLNLESIDKTESGKKEMAELLERHPKLKNDIISLDELEKVERELNCRIIVHAFLTKDLKITHSAVDTINYGIIKNNQTKHDDCMHVFLLEQVDSVNKVTGETEKKDVKSDSVKNYDLKDRSSVNSHYMYVTNPETFYCLEKNHVIKMCMTCFAGFTSKAEYELHTLSGCLQNDSACIEKMPEEKDAFIKFDKYEKMIPLPLFLTADFESTNCEIPIFDEKQKNVSEQRANSFGICEVEYNANMNNITKKVCTIVCPDKHTSTMPLFFEELEKIGKRYVENVYSHNYPARNIYYAYGPENTEKQREIAEQKECGFCGLEFCKDNNNEDYDNLKKDIFNDKSKPYNNVIFAAHTSCIKKYGRKPRMIPVLFHNGCGYDFHLVLKALPVGWRPCNFIPNGAEKVLTFSISRKFKLPSYTKTKYVGTGRIFSNGSEERLPQTETIEPGNVDIQFMFVDSIRLMTTGGSDSSLSSFMDSLSKREKTDKDAYKYMKLYFGEEDAEFLKQKNPYPYEFVKEDSSLDTPIDKITKDNFNSKLTDKQISDKEFEFFKTATSRMHCKTLRDYHNVYLAVDVLALADVVCAFRKISYERFGIDPLYFFTLASYTKQAMFKSLGVKLPLITNANIYRMLENNKRGGMSGIMKRYARANNKYMKPLTITRNGKEETIEYDPSKPSTFLIDLDMNALYTHTMSGLLPDTAPEQISEKGFIEENIMGLDENGEDCYFLLIDGYFPPECHDKLNDYTPMPVHKITDYAELSSRSVEMNEAYGAKQFKTRKLCNTLEKRERYLVHFRHLKLSIRLGFKVTKVHKVFKCHQSKWMAHFMEENTRQRMIAAGMGDDFLVAFYKAICNIMYGKMIECCRNRDSVTVRCTERKTKYGNASAVKSIIRSLALLPTDKQNLHVLNDNFVAVQKIKPVVTLNMPEHVGFGILEISKVIMYEFYYDVLQNMYGDKMQLLFTDTDSLMIEVETEDFYEDMKKMGLDKFDCSSFPKDHRLFSNENRKIAGKMKLEHAGEQIVEFIGLRPKMYSMIFDSDNCDGAPRCDMRAKGVSHVARKHITHEKYYNTLMDFNAPLPVCESFALRSKNHTIQMVRDIKIALAANDDKRYILEDGIHTRAHGHWRNSKPEHEPKMTEYASNILTNYLESQPNGIMKEECQYDEFTEPNVSNMCPEIEDAVDDERDSAEDADVQDGQDGDFY